MLLDFNKPYPLYSLPLEIRGREYIRRGASAPLRCPISLTSLQGEEI
jgi:hypothetical protein